MSDRGRAAGFMALSALAGVVSAGVFLAVAEVAALVVARESSPILAVGSFVIDVVPQPLKELAISTFGAYDKIALLVGLGLAVVIAAAVAGVLQFLRPPLGVVALGIAAALSIAAIVTREGASAWAWLPPLLGAGAGAAVLVLAVRRLRRWADAAAHGQRGPAEDAPPDGGAAAARSPKLDRRRFFQIVGVAGASAVVIGIAARAANVAVTSIAAVRRALRLPEPRTRVAVPDGAEFDIPGLTPLYTPNDDFYRVDTALTVPAIDPATWRLRVGGLVDEPVELSFDDLVAMGLDEYSITLTCVSNEVGGDLLGTAKWLGVPVRDVLALAAPRAGADMVLSRSVDGFTASTPLEALTDDARDAILAVGMNGEPLPLEHGFPVRMVVPGLYGYVSATKWLTELKVTTFAADEAYWTPRGYSARAPIKFSSRLDTPRTGQPVAAGAVVLAGVAWAQTVGIERVEVKIDGGDWQAATLSSAVNDDTWVQWFLEWDAAPGNHDIVVRAVDRAGQLQVEERAPIAPDGSSGWQRTLVRAE
ncbi:molybdopterin-dependent oxidoreductase [Microbacterium gallinarum]|jgi:DMSO/TMAO reductase YedYZ molybdopterin-dependent catalytic subunit|uniref:Molybdopterin-dependent oxidoreductase n=1 Tax=Microbacterium gallinarum TaxID=2762209 RepID=A0ABR8X2U1_9MICO|nr:molybdopterin-dependent oxidoreductase [Microbacterium gallinarum]MBD8023512.1 molybdopterin-dependent oxidoreductase [Microbacterium gallinarum]